MPATDRVNQYQRAFLAWPVLTETAAKNTTITYKELGQQIGIHHRTVRLVLSVIQDYCLDEKLPPLTILVVNRDHHTPGEGFIAWDIDDLAEGTRRVYGYPWQELSNPFAFADDGATLDQLAQRLVTTPEAAASVYGRIRNRGIAQDVFRRALLAAYGQRCAFCGLSLKVALQAAHIIPWREASDAQRLSPTNGLLLCSTHHALFDAHVLTVTTNGQIVCHLNNPSAKHWTDADRHAAIVFQGRGVSLPADERLRPSTAALAYRAERLPD